MKHSRNLLLLFVTGLFIFGCSKDDLQWNLNEVVRLADIKLNSISSITNESATISGSLDFTGGVELIQIGICYSDSNEEPDVNSSLQLFNTTPDVGPISMALSGLTKNTTYHVRFFAENEAGIAYSTSKSFLTTNYTPATLVTNEAQNVLFTAAEVGGNITSNGGQEITSKGICYGVNTNPSINDLVQNVDGSGKQFLASLTGLSSSTIYYARAYAENAAGIAYGNEISFTTQSYSLPEVTTSTVLSVTTNSAQSGGIIVNDGGDQITQKGIVLSSSNFPTLDDIVFSSGAGNEDFVTAMSGLEDGTTYNIRAFATNSVGTAYGNQITFTTVEITLPEVTTTSVNSITDNAATAGGSISNNGGASITSRGVVISSTNPNPTLNDQVFSSGSGNGSFSVNLTGLSSTTTYYVRAFATNSAGTAYGNSISFETSEQIFLPTVTTNSVSSITTNSAYCGGNVTSDGGGNVSSRGIVLSTSSNPSLSDQVYNSGTGVGSFNTSLTGLNSSTTYYVRAFATNSAGTAYGYIQSFTTDIIVTTPDVMTTTASSITSNSAVVSGTVNFDGGDNVTQRGIVLSTSSMPDLGDLVFSSGSGVGAFSADVTGLNSSTTYYARAYATNSAGTSYGNQINFTTSSPVPVLVETEDCNGLSGVSSQYTYWGGSSTEYAPWGIGSGYNGNCWAAPPPGASGGAGNTTTGPHYVEFTHTFQNEGYIEFWLNTFNPGYNNVFPSVIVDNGSEMTETPVMIGGSTSSWDWMQVQTSSISAGTHTIKIMFYGSNYDYGVDQIDFYEYQ